LTVPDHHAPIAILPHSPREHRPSFSAMPVPIIGRPQNRNHRGHRISAYIGLAVLAMIGCHPVDAEPVTVRPIALRSAYAPFAAFIAEASQRFGIPAAWIHAVMRAESACIRCFSSLLTHGWVKESCHAECQLFLGQT